MPLLFIGHGHPMNALMDNAFTQRLTKLGKDMDKPSAVLVISAHWETFLGGCSQVASCLIA